jgi:hypothetical protein
MSELPTLHDAQSGQEALFSRPLPEWAGVEAPAKTPAKKSSTPATARLPLCHNCGGLMHADLVGCPECGAYACMPEKRERVARETITIRLADNAGPNDPPMSARLKRALKALGRAYKLRVISMETK